MSARDVAALTLPPQLLANCNVVLFEDETISTDLFPLAVLRPSWEIFSGAGTLRRWVQDLIAGDCSLVLRPRSELEAVSQLIADASESSWDNDADVLFINGRVIGVWSETTTADELPSTYVDASGRLLWTRLSATAARKYVNMRGTNLAVALVQETGQKPRSLDGWTVLAADYVWDYMRHNGRLLERQLGLAPRTATEWLGAHVLRELPAGVHLTDKSGGWPIWVGANSRLMPGVVLGNSTGPIWIGSGVEIEPHTYLQGPIYIDAHGRVKSGTKIYKDTSLGVHCRVAGEISQTVMQGYVNKQHDGFLGNSHLGSWVNLGADTVTSNLRNDYATVKVRVNNQLVDSGERFVGLMCGDHTKTGINTMFNTATVVGIAANIFGGGYPTSWIDSFQWGGKEGFRMGDLQRTLETARFAMSRRGQSLSHAEEELMTGHHRQVTEKRNSKA